MSQNRMQRTLAAIAIVVLALLASTVRATAATGDVSTLAGSGLAGATDGAGSTATFSSPSGVVTDSFGNVFVADQGNNVIRKITPGGIVSTFAGSVIAGNSDGLGAAASFNGPFALAIDATNTLYVSDRQNLTIRKITPAGLVSTFAGSGVSGTVDGLGSLASFVGPNGIAVDGTGNVFLADTSNNGDSTIRKITPAGLVSTFAGSGTIGFADGQGTAAMFYSAEGVVIDSGNNLFVTDIRNYRVRKITSSGLVSTFAGSGLSAHTNGIGIAAAFKFPQALAIDAAGNLYVGDRYAYRVRKITTAAVVTDIAGNGSSGNADGAPSVAQFQDLIGLTTDPAGNVFVADMGNNVIRMLESAAVGCSSLSSCPSPPPATATTTTTTTAVVPGGCRLAATACPTTSTTVPVSIACPTAPVYDLAGVPSCPTMTVPPVTVPATTVPPTTVPPTTVPPTTVSPTAASTSTTSSTTTPLFAAIQAAPEVPTAVVPAPSMAYATPAYTGTSAIPTALAALALLTAGLVLTLLGQRRAG